MFASWSTLQTSVLEGGRKQKKNVGGGLNLSNSVSQGKRKEEFKYRLGDVMVKSGKMEKVIKKRHLCISRWHQIKGIGKNRYQIKRLCV
jgi:hypothetical protein